MDILKSIKNYGNTGTSIFLGLADNIIAEFGQKLNTKTYLLVPEERVELKEMAYEYMLANVTVMPIDLILSVTRINRKFIEVAENLGFTVIYDMKDYHNDGELYDLMGTSSVNRGSINEENNNIERVLSPVTLSVEEFCLSPFLPCVFKNATANRGEDKYLIESKEQLEKILGLFELPESKEISLKSQFVVQEYIKGLDAINSSLRVITTCTGEILCPLFLYNDAVTSKTNIKKYGIGRFNPCEYLIDKESKYYLNAQNIVSNYSSGGKAVSLNQKSELSTEEEIILWMHGFDVENLILPQEVVDSCKVIAENYGTSKGVVLGIDFIFNSLNSEWYYLEANRNPSVDGYRYFMDLKGYSKKDAKALMHLEAILKIVESILFRENNVQR